MSSFEAIALVKTPASNPNSMTILCSFSRCETIWGPVLGWHSRGYFLGLRPSRA